MLLADSSLDLAITDLARDLLMTVLVLAGPVLLVGLVVGVAVSLFQALTSVQEMTIGLTRERSERLLDGADLKVRVRSMCVPLEPEADLEVLDRSLSAQGGTRLTRHHTGQFWSRRWECERCLRQHRTVYAHSKRLLHGGT